MRWLFIASDGYAVEVTPKHAINDAALLLELYVHILQIEGYIAYSLPPILTQSK